MSNNKYSVSNNEGLKRFEIHESGEIAFLEYRFYQDRIVLMHTLVPPSLEGKGIATELAKSSLDWAKENGMPVIVYCPFVAAFLKRHPEYMENVEKVNLNE